MKRFRCNHNVDVFQEIKENSVRAVFDSKFAVKNLFQKLILVHHLTVDGVFLVKFGICSIFAKDSLETVLPVIGTGRCVYKELCEFDLLTEQSSK